MPHIIDLTLRIGWVTPVKGSGVVRWYVLFFHKTVNTKTHRVGLHVLVHQDVRIVPERSFRSTSDIPCRSLHFILKPWVYVFFVVLHRNVGQGLGGAASIDATIEICIVIAVRISDRGVASVPRTIRNQ